VIYSVHLQPRYDSVMKPPVKGARSGPEKTAMLKTWRRISKTHDDPKPAASYRYSQATLAIVKEVGKDGPNSGQWASAEEA